MRLTKYASMLLLVVFYLAVRAPKAQSILDTTQEAVLVVQRGDVEAAFTLFQEGQRLSNEGSADSLQQAIVVWRQSLLLFVSNNAQRQAAATSNSIGLAYASLGENERALEYYTQALSLARAVGYPAAEAAIASNIGSIYSSLGENERALEYFTQALSLARAAGDRAGEATRLNNIGSVYASLGENERALDYYTQALPLVQSVGDRAKEAITLSNIGGVYAALSENERALEYYTQALSLAQTVGDRAGEATTLNNIGGVYAALSENERALEYYTQALSLMKIVGNRADEALALSSLGSIYSSLGENERALEYFTQALPLAQAVGSRAVEANVLNNTGGVYFRLGENERALEYYAQALSLFQTVGNRSGEANVLNSIGGIHSSQGEKERALNYFTQSLSLFQAAGNRSDEANMLSNIGAIYSSLGEKERALEYYAQALSLQKAVGDRAGEANTLSNIGTVYTSLREAERALEYYAQALPLARTIGNRPSEAIILTRIAFEYQAQGNLSDALIAISNAIDIFEDLRLAVSLGELRVSYFSTVQEYYQLKIDLLMQMGQFEAAFETSEASRARLLVELLSESNVNIRQGNAPELLKKEAALRRELAQVEQQRIILRSSDHTSEQAAALDLESSSTLEQLDQIISQIRRTSPAYADIVQPQPLTLVQIQQEVLDSDTVLLQYVLGKDSSYLWIVGQDYFESYTLPAAADIQSIAAQFQSAVSTQGNPSAEVKRKGDELVSLILPEVPEWFTSKRLLIAGDGIISELPFAALPLPNKAEYIPLLTEHEVLTQPSITAISVLRQQLANRQQLPPSIAVLADPVYRVDDERLAQAERAEATAPVILSSTERNLRDLDLRAINRLPYTRTEADNILQLAANNNIKNSQALNFDANIDWITATELSDYSLVHLATHGFINPVNPQLSGLVLTLVDEEGQLRDRGFLRLHDIFNLKLDAELVVLSACQTGIGEAISGEGIVGLSRGFMYAGAERVAVSLWNVNDEATAYLMSDFYRYLIEDSLTPAAAMRSAQLDAWKAGQSPYLWAAFTLQGEWLP